jgi:hypothetical protein
MSAWDGKIVTASGQLTDIPDVSKEKDVVVGDKNVADIVKKAVADALERQKREFAQEVLRYDAGCAEGKVEFLENAGLPVPRISAKVSFEVEDIDWTDDVYQLEADIETIVDYISLDSGYIQNIVVTVNDAYDA